LALRLGIRGLVRWRVGHDHRRAVEDLGRAAVAQPRILRAATDGSPGLADQVPDDRFGEALAGLARAARLDARRGEPLIVADLLEAIDSVVTGVVVGEEL
jgi:hypothetical protein